MSNEVSGDGLSLEANRKVKCASSTIQGRLTLVHQSVVGQGDTEELGDEAEVNVAADLYEADLKKVELMIDRLNRIDFANIIDSAAFFGALTRLGDTLSMIAKALGITHGSLSRWARGEGQPNPNSHHRIRENLRRYLEAYRDLGLIPLIREVRGGPVS